MPYKIRSHAEDRAGASLQAYWPVGEPVTTFKLNVAEKAAAIHSGVIAANVEEEKACRTKVAAASNVERILENWNRAANFGWHRVSVVGGLQEGAGDRGEAPRLQGRGGGQVAPGGPRGALKQN